MTVHKMRRRFGFVNSISAPVQPAGFGTAVCAGSQYGDNFIHTVSSSGSRKACDGKLRACQRLFGQLVFFDDADSGCRCVVHKGYGGRRTCRDRYVLRMVYGYHIALGRSFFPNKVVSGLKIRKGGNAIRPGGLGLQYSACRVQQFIHSSGQCRACLSVLFHDRYRSHGYFKGKREGLQMIGHALLRNQHLLNGCGRNAYQEAGFFLLGGNRFYNNGKGDLTGGDGKGIAAVQIVIVVICAGTIAGKADGRFADAHPIRVGSQGHCTHISVSGKTGELPRYLDIASDPAPGNAVCRQPAGVFQINGGSLSTGSVKVVHIPVRTDILRALHFADDLTDGELSRHARPGKIIRIAAIQRHKGIGMPKHPADGVQCGFVIENAGIAGVAAIGIHIYDQVGTFGLLAPAVDVFTGPGKIVFQAIHSKALQIMGRSVNRTVIRRFGNLQIIAVLSGTAIQPALSHRKGRNGRMDGFQAEPIHGAGRTKTESLRQDWQRIVRNRQGLRVRGSCFAGQHIDGRRICPFQRTICKIISIKITHQQPAAVLGVLLPPFYQHHGGVYENAHAAFFISGFRHMGIDSRGRGNSSVVARLNDEWFFRWNFFCGFFSFFRLLQGRALKRRFGSCFDFFTCCREGKQLAPICGSPGRRTCARQRAGFLVCQDGFGQGAFRHISGEGFFLPGDPPDLNTAEIRLADQLRSQQHSTAGKAEKGDSIVCRRIDLGSA